jgi:chemotaxis protein histidine kinase CheA
MSTAALESVNGVAVGEPRFDPVALAKAEAIRTEAAAKADALRAEAEGKAKAAEILAEQEAEKQRIANDRQAMRLEKEKADHEAYLAEKAAKAAKAKAEEDKATQEAEDAAAEEAARAKEQQRSEEIWKWGARGIYAVGLIIAAPVQFMHFWDRDRPFLVAAPALLEGLALVLAFGAAWAVAHRRDVAPFRVGIMIGALIAAGINLYGGLGDPRIGLNAGIIGAIASLGGPIVLMAYEHGIAQQADGIPSRRERRAAKRAKARELAEKARAKAEKQAAEAKAATERAEQQQRAEEEQKRKDDDRRAAHEKVWNVADAMRSARGAQYVTEQIWADAWYRVTGSKVVGITPEIEAQSRAAQARMKTATAAPILGEFSQVESQKGRPAKKDPEAPDGRRSNGGTPPRRTPGDTAPYSPLARKQAVIEQVVRAASPEEQS